MCTRKRTIQDESELPSFSDIADSDGVGVHILHAFVTIAVHAFGSQMGIVSHWTSPHAAAGLAPISRQLLVVSGFALFFLLIL